FSSRRRHTRFSRDWSSDVCSSDLLLKPLSQHRQKFTFAWPYFKHQMLIRQRRTVQQLDHLLGIYRIAGDQILLRPELVRVFAEKQLRHLTALLMQLLQLLRNGFCDGLLINGTEQLQLEGG